ncbi:flagellar protein FlhE [Pseudoalteromonas luteoviolacea]|uniref:flagellar protein FlhE n=1 Tax=Pseudoalteromonas luteoviolacea TaxID=43657 RepID=UPI001F1C3735|nr:flagellar protein FlhE [Pseudoalteromonas luteoviolacea]MCF6440495.1 flagellar protein FlhE [Pseudoalteromonas luteoviolacea]
MFKISVKKVSAMVASVAMLWAGTASAQSQYEVPELLSPSVSVSQDLVSLDSVDGPIFINSGAWASSGVPPTIRHTGLLYSLDLPVVGSVPFGSTINTVNYNWSLSRVPAGLEVYLCWRSTSACVDVSSRRSGSLSNFRGLAANQKFIYAFVIRGNGSVVSPAAFGRTSQVIVNYQ